MRHLRNYAHLDTCEVVALSELREQTGARVAARYGIPSVYREAGEMLKKESLDALVASQPFNRHGVLLPELLKAGIPIFIEKPLSSSVESGEAILKALEKSGRLYLLGIRLRVRCTG